MVLPTSSPQAYYIVRFHSCRLWNDNLQAKWLLLLGGPPRTQIPLSSWDKGLMIPSYPWQHTMNKGFYIRASLRAQLVKNLPAMWETWVQSLGWEDPLEKGKATHSSVLAWRIPWTTWTTVHGVAKSRTRLSDFHFRISQRRLRATACVIAYLGEDLQVCLSY